MRRCLRDPTFSRFDTIPECDRQIHRQTHRHTHRHTTTAYTALSIASRGKNVTHSETRRTYSLIDVQTHAGSSSSIPSRITMRTLQQRTCRTTPNRDLFIMCDLLISIALPCTHYLVFIAKSFCLRKNWTGSPKIYYECNKRPQQLS